MFFNIAGNYAENGQPTSVIGNIHVDPVQISFTILTKDCCPAAIMGHHLFVVDFGC